MTFTLRIFDRETCESKLNKAQNKKRIKEERECYAKRNHGAVLRWQEPTTSDQGAALE